ncbi:hypothetical protein MG293_000957 [Ovis ammon polii]|uniref:SUEL-type lectin domain-containing protein n=1 Tax=Ovis ammon polii TaxID=230172 RepID=A0AAD4UL97_OVIAM|nr:hypothetical protein MG293_000957 [Ovis ammon polii]KAI4579356.1 hypothetical protein MJT46_000724 [Ovis ammon polii x Ovis aries]
MLLPGHARPPSAPQPAQHPGLRRQVEPPGQLLRLFYCTVLVCSKEIAALTDFSGKKRPPSLSGPRRRGALRRQGKAMPALVETARQTSEVMKVLDECQNQRACHLLVNSRVFGPDLCPGSSKYLLVSFKCQPNELKNKTVCEDHELKLHCHESKFLNIYSATYGRRTQERDVCSSEAERLPPFDCLSYSALHVLSRRCYGKQRCKVLVNNRHFGSPCLPGVKKYLSVFYACVPKNILMAIDPSVANLKPSVKQKDGDYAHPERAALLFVSSVCVGLALTLCALVTRVSCTKDFQELQLAREHLVPGSDKAEEDSQDEEGEEDSSDSDLPGDLSGFGRTTYPVYSSIEAAELAERIERREQIIQEIWMNSGLDTSLPRNMGQFY